MESDRGDVDAMEVDEGMGGNHRGHMNGADPRSDHKGDEEYETVSHGNGNPNLEVSMDVDGERRLAELAEEIDMSTPAPTAKTAPLPTSTASKIAKAEELKAVGNEHFGKKEYQKAIKNYRYVFTYVNGLVSSGGDMAQYANSGELLSTEDEATVNNLKLTCYSNLAACYVNIGNGAKALDCSRKALAIDKSHSKALFRQGQAYMFLREYQKAVESLVAAAKLEPQNRTIRKTLEECKLGFEAWKKSNKAKEKEMFGNVL